MPNHCENDLHISGEKADVDKLLAFIGADKEKTEFDFSKIIPYPERFEQMDREMKEAQETPEGREAYKAKWGTASDGFNSGGYEWRIREWGTKWGAYDVARRDYEGVVLTFQTAWSPPFPVIVALAKMFPTVHLSLEYFEQGAAFAGGFQCVPKDDWYDEKEPWEAGKVTDEWKAKYLGTRGG